MQLDSSAKGGGVIYYTGKRKGLVADERFGYVHLYYGEGVGKTTRAVGIAIRAAGEGLKVTFIQFMKSGGSGEVRIFRQVPNITYYCPGKHPFILSKGPEEVHYLHARKAFERAMNAARGASRVLVCDEILNTLIFGVLQKEALHELIDGCIGKTDLIMTGRHAPRDLVERADYATELVQVKHPYYRGVRARRGIEY